MKGGIHIFNVNNAIEANESMTIRDYIAIQAMSGLLAGISASHGNRPMPSYEAIAKDCYKMADAMIKQSEVRDEQSV